MVTVKKKYMRTVTDFQDRSLIKASLWTSRTIKDLQSLKKKTHVLTGADRIVIFLRGVIAFSIWLPVHLIAVPYTLILGSLNKKNPQWIKAAKLHEITPGLYLGTVDAATDENLLKQHEITKVISLVDFKVVVPKHITKHFWISMRDLPHVDIAPIIKQALPLVKEAVKKKEKILVHCRKGKSRSVIIVAAIVQKMLKIGPREAIRYIRRKRPEVNLNYGFRKQFLRMHN